MGKKKKSEKKGKGAEKTAIKTERNQERKMKKALQEQGEGDIEALIAEFQERDRKMCNVVEEKCPPPSLRSGMSLTSHPLKDELIMFGGEFFNGSKTFMYNDLYLYNIKKNNWLKVTCPNCPPPRTSHQAAAIGQDGGQLWVFGGEFASPSQSQFYHYKDLWAYHLTSKNWEKVSAPGGPSSRSGHRMISFRKLLIVFGGFHDNIRDYKYYNDLHTFNLDTRTWQKIDIVGIPPSPRSGCQLAACQDHSKIIVFGGYSKSTVKKEVDKGMVHFDMFTLAPEGAAGSGSSSGYKRNEDSGATATATATATSITSTPTKWKWTLVRQSANKPTARCGFSLAVAPGNKAFIFGGVLDEEDTEEDLEGTFFNDLHLLEIEKTKWHQVSYKGVKMIVEKTKRRRKDKIRHDSCDEDKDISDVSVDIEVEQDPNEDVTQEIDSLDIDSEKGACSADIFTVTMETNISTPSKADIVTMEKKNVFVPQTRMNAAMVIKNSILYLYGGIYEEGDKQITLDDLYCLDVTKMDTWITLKPATTKQLWQEDSESSTDDDDDDLEDMEVDVPCVSEGECLADYFKRTHDIWLKVAEESLKEDGLLDASCRQIKRHASELCEAHYAIYTRTSEAQELSQSLSNQVS